MNFGDFLIVVLLNISFVLLERICSKVSSGISDYQESAKEDVDSIEEVESISSEDSECRDEIEEVEEIEEEPTTNDDDDTSDSNSSDKSDTTFDDLVHLLQTKNTNDVIPACGRSVVQPSELKTTERVLPVCVGRVVKIPPSELKSTESTAPICIGRLVEFQPTESKITEEELPNFIKSELERLYPTFYRKVYLENDPIVNKINVNTYRVTSSDGKMSFVYEHRLRK